MPELLRLELTYDASILRGAVPTKSTSASSPIVFSDTFSAAIASAIGATSVDTVGGGVGDVTSCWAGTDDTNGPSGSPRDNRGSLTSSSLLHPWVLLGTCNWAELGEGRPTGAVAKMHRLPLRMLFPTSPYSAYSARRVVPTSPASTAGEEQAAYTGTDTATDIDTDTVMGTQTRSTQSGRALGGAPGPALLVHTFDFWNEQYRCTTVPVQTRTSSTGSYTGGTDVRACHCPCTPSSCLTFPSSPGPSVSNTSTRARARSLQPAAAAEAAEVMYETNKVPTRSALILAVRVQCVACARTTPLYLGSNLHFSCGLELTSLSFSEEEFFDRLGEKLGRGDPGHSYDCGSNTTNSDNYNGANIRTSAKSGKEEVFMGMRASETETVKEAAPILVSTTMRLDLCFDSASLREEAWGGFVWLFLPFSSTYAGLNYYYQPSTSPLIARY